MTLLNQPQRINALGNGGAVATNEAWQPVARPNIEAAARCGYRDRANGSGFSPDYDAAPPPWQRNYEIGRLWATGMICCGIEPPDWPETQQQTPMAITDALAKVNAQLGPLRPEIEGIKAPSNDLPVLHEPLRIPRRLLRRVA